MDHDRTRVNGREWHALPAREPDAVPVVIVHGLGAASEAQRPVAGELARHFRVLAPDLPGFGRSEAPGGRLDVAGYLAPAVKGTRACAGMLRRVTAGGCVRAR